MENKHHRQIRRFRRLCTAHLLGGWKSLLLVWTLVKAKALINLAQAKLRVPWCLSKAVTDGRGSPCLTDDRAQETRGGSWTPPEDLGCGAGTCSIHAYSTPQHQSDRRSGVHGLSQTGLPKSWHAVKSHWQTKMAAEAYPEGAPQRSQIPDHTFQQNSGII